MGCPVITGSTRSPAKNRKALQQSEPVVDPYEILVKETAHTVSSTEQNLLEAPRPQAIPINRSFLVSIP